jgi:hypothetical protein
MAKLAGSQHDACEIKARSRQVPRWFPGPLTHLNATVGGG